MYTLRILPLSKDTAELYQNHSFFHEGDAGYDLFFREDDELAVGDTKLIDFGIKAEMIDDKGNNVTYILTPRSSVYKTPLRQSNSIGVIDAGYRGELKVPLDHIVSSSYFKKDGTIDMNQTCKITRGQRLFQLCHPTMAPFRVEIVDSLSETDRGEKGFGSTGK